MDANAEYCAVIKTKLGAHRILMGAEMDCCDSTDEGRRFYVELKTSREVDSNESIVTYQEFFHSLGFQCSTFLCSYNLYFFLVICSWISVLKKDMRERNCLNSGYLCNSCLTLDYLVLCY